MVVNLRRSFPGFHPNSDLDGTLENQNNGEETLLQNLNHTLLIRNLHHATVSTNTRLRIGEDPLQIARQTHFCPLRAVEFAM